MAGPRVDDGTSGPSYVDGGSSNPSAPQRNGGDGNGGGDTLVIGNWSGAGVDLPPGGADDHGDLDSPTVNLNDCYMEGIEFKMMSMQGDIQTNRLDTQTGRLDQIADRAEAKNKELMDQVSKQLELLAKSGKNNTATTIIGACGLAAAVLVTGCTIGTGSAAGAALAVASLVLMGTNFTLSATHTYDHMSEDGAKWLEYSLMIGGAVTGMAAGGVCAFGSAAVATDTTAVAGETAAEGSAAASEAATEGGMAAAEASTPSEAADALVEGVYQGTAAMESAGETGAETTALAQSATVADDGAGGASSMQSLGDAGTDPATGVTDDAAASAAPKSSQADSGGSADKAGPEADDDIDISDLELDDAAPSAAQEAEVAGPEGGSADEGAEQQVAKPDPNADSGVDIDDIVPEDTAPPEGEETVTGEETRTGDAPEDAAAKQDPEDEDADSRMKKVMDMTTRVGRAIQAVDAASEGELAFEKADIDRDMSRLESRRTGIDAKEKYYDSLTKANSELIQDIFESWEHVQRLGAESIGTHTETNQVLSDNLVEEMV